MPGGLSAAPAPLVPEKHSVIETPLYRAEFTNRGARLVDFQLKRFAAAHGPSNFSEHPGKLPRRGQDVPSEDRVRLTGEPTFGLYEHKRSFGASWLALAGARERVARPWRYQAGRVTSRLARAVGGRR